MITWAIDYSRTKEDVEIMGFAALADFALLPEWVAIRDAMKYTLLLQDVPLLAVVVNFGDRSPAQHMTSIT